jgi:hypothetical protein
MKLVLLSIFCIFQGFTGVSQSLQLRYDLRHWAYPDLNPENFPALSFEYFKNFDTIRSGSFLLKLDANFDGKKYNIGQTYTQISYSVKFWKPGIYLSFTYSGGLGVTSSSFGYYIANSFGLGPAYPFQWKDAWMSTSLCIRLNVFEKPSYDPQLTLYFGKGFINFKIFTASSFVFWTENRNRGDAFTSHLKGKKFAFYGDPQVWIKIKNGLSAGARISVYYHILTEDHNIQLYPSVGLKYGF